MDSLGSVQLKVTAFYFLKNTVQKLTIKCADAAVFKEALD